MSTAFAGYTDAFTPTTGNAPAEESKFHQLARALRKLKRKNKKLKRSIKEQYAAEEKRASEEQKREAEEAQKKEKSLWERIGDAIEKAIPAICVAIASIFAKSFFSRRKECKCA